MRCNICQGGGILMLVISHQKSTNMEKCLDLYSERNICVKRNGTWLQLCLMPKCGIGYSVNPRKNPDYLDNSDQPA